METPEALRIISSLSIAVDPKTGKELPKRGVYRYPEVIEALRIARQALTQIAAEERRRSRNRSLEEEEEELLESEPTFDELQEEGGEEEEDLAEEEDREYLEDALRYVDNVARSDDEGWFYSDQD